MSGKSKREKEVIDAMRKAYDMGYDMNNIIIDIGLYGVVVREKVRTPREFGVILDEHDEIVGITHCCSPGKLTSELHIVKGIEVLE